MSITEMHVAVFRLTCKSGSVKVKEATTHSSSFWYTENKKVLTPTFVRLMDIQNRFIIRTSLEVQEKLNL